MANKYETDLRKYIENAFKRQEELKLSPESTRGWAFGAITFARAAGLIDKKTKDALLGEYNLIEKGN